MIGGNRFSFSKHRRGFTMAELLVVVAVFSIASVAISGIYVNFTRLHRRVANAETLNEEVQYLAELIVREARNLRISYSPNPLPYQMSQLNLQNAEGGMVSIKLMDPGSAACANLNTPTGCLGIYIDGRTADYVALSGKNIDVKQFSVYVTPAEDPFLASGFGVYANDRQPVVTIFLKVEYNAGNALERASMTFQTSVSSREYAR